MFTVDVKQKHNNNDNKLSILEIFSNVIAGRETLCFKHQLLRVFCLIIKLYLTSQKMILTGHVTTVKGLFVFRHRARTRDPS